MLEEDPENEEIVARVAACDIGKAELVCCARLRTRTARGGGSRKSRRGPR
jgi:hypothetical protein